MIYQPTLDHAQKVERSVEQMKLAGAMSERYYGKPILVCYSGGKDSDVLLDIAKRSGIAFEVQHSLTSVDFPETVRHVKKVFSALKADGIEARIVVPHYRDGRRKTMWNLISRKSLPPTRICRYCCGELKEAAGNHRAIATGVRRAESVARSKRGFAANIHRTKGEQLEYEDVWSLFNDADHFVEHDSKFLDSCKVQGRTAFNPIIEWLDDDVWQHIEENGIEINPLYAEGKKRVGCIGCPLARRSEREDDFARYPQYRDAYMRAFEKMLEHRKESGKPTEWEDAEDVMNWWMEVDV